MLTRCLVVSTLTVVLLAGQVPARKDGGEPNEAEFLDAVQRWSAGQKAGDTQPADDRASRFAIAHEDLAIPILMNAVEAKLGDKEGLKDKRTEYFILVAVDLITYNATPRAVDAVAELCLIDAERCPRLVTKLLNKGTVQNHPFATAYDVVERFPGLREHVLPWVEERTTKMAQMLARELLKREKAGHPANESDVILSGLTPAAREAVGRALLRERTEEGQQQK